jgi:hypothetical protein
MLLKVEKDKKNAQVEVLALANLRKPSFYQDFYTANIEHIKDFRYKAKDHH